MSSLSDLVKLNEDSQLKVHLNDGVASLQNATESHFQPHICLNGEEGFEVLGKINQKSNTEFWLGESMIKSTDEVWLNITFGIFLDKISWPSNHVRLTSRQTGYVVKRLPKESQRIVLEKVKKWYFENFLNQIQSGIDAITKQFNEGDFLVEDDHDNRIFDIHGGRSSDVPYTEGPLVGEKLFYPFFYGATCLDSNPDGYKEVDDLLRNIKRERDGVVGGLLSLMKAFQCY